MWLLCNIGHGKHLVAIRRGIPHALTYITVAIAKTSEGRMSDL